jgi:hypothetical protein
MKTRHVSVVVAVVTSVALGGCRQPDVPAVGTPELRAALFDTILARTERREAWSPIKNERLAFDPLADMRAMREMVVSAETEVDLFYALQRLSNARRDRHLDIFEVEGGLELEDSEGLEFYDTGDPPPARHAPVKIFPDYSADDAGYFVGDIATDAGLPDLPSVGDRIVTINGLSVDEWMSSAAPYMRHSSLIGLRWKLAEGLPQSSAVYPPSLRSDELTLMVESATGEESGYSLPYLDASSLHWTGSGAPRYPGFSKQLETPTFDLLVPDDDRRVLLLVWYGFRETMIADVDRLVEHAQREGLLEHTLVMDVTRSRGGSLGPYAMQRLQPLPFKTTFGNLRMSDVVEPFIEDKRADFLASNINDSGTPETIDDGTWLMEWLDEDVAPGLERGDAYTTNVPFKSAHAPKDSDGILQPAEVGFTGPFAIISGPNGGSHLDQFNSIVVDNRLGPIVGMPAGGYSNTWEWYDVLTFPGTDQPVVAFMWSIGHSIRPNGEILEGNPAAVDEWVPLTARNVEDYYSLLLERALAHLDPAH